MNNTKKCEYLVACESGNMSLIEKVNEQVKGVPSDIKQEGLEIACSCGNKKVVEYILKNSCRGDIDKEPCIRIATKKGYANIVVSLITDSFKYNPHMQ